MTAIVYLLALCAAGRAAAAAVDLDCESYACVDSLAKDLARSLRQQKTVRVFDILTVEPLRRPPQTEARGAQSPLARFMDNHAFSFDVSDYTVRLLRPEMRNDALELEVFQGRTAKDAPVELAPKKSASKVEEDKPEEKKPKGIRRRQKRKVLQALIPMMFGMKSAGTVIFAMAVVTALTLKAFFASKMALFVTVGMALKRLYENYQFGVGLQNHPYLYSQYPIDFPSASSNAYSVSGVGTNFASPEMYQPTALGSHSHQHEMLQQGDTAAQQSQQAPTVQLANGTRASERWDGKSSLLRFLEPLVTGIRNVVSPIASVFYDAMPATFRGLTSDGAKQKPHSVEPAAAASATHEEKAKMPREILAPQPRNIAQRKTTNARKLARRHIPKKFTELKVDLDKLKRNKDFHDYMKTKKYKHNYPYTSFYPRVKYYTNPNSFVVKPNNSRLAYYNKVNTSTFVNKIPVTTYPTTTNPPVSVSNTNSSLSNKNETLLDKDNLDDWQPLIFSEYRDSKAHVRSKRHSTSSNINSSVNIGATGRGLKEEKGRGLFGFIDFLFAPDPMQEIIEATDKYTKALLKHQAEDTADVEPVGPPKYYLLTYDMLLFSLAVIDDFVNMNSAIYDHLAPKKPKKTKKPKMKGSPKSKPKTSHVNTNTTSAITVTRRKG